jgi:hypothetical protein
MQITISSSRHKGCPALTKPELRESNKNQIINCKWVPETKIKWPTDNQYQHNIGVEFDSFFAVPGM